MNDDSDPPHHFLREPKTHAERIAYELRRSIARGELKPGAPLEIKSLAEKLSISPIPVREALKQLEIEGFVTIEPYRGPRVAQMSAQEIVDFTELRIALDTLALELVVPTMAARDVADARAILDELERVRDSGDWATLIHDFYLALFASAGRPILLRFVHLAGVAGMRYMSVYVRKVAARRFDRTPYEQLLRACERRDVDKAKKLLVQLRRRIQDGLFEALSEREAAPRRAASTVAKPPATRPAPRAPARRAAAKPASRPGVKPAKPPRATARARAR